MVIPIWLFSAQLTIVLTFKWYNFTRSLISTKIRFVSAFFRKLQSQLYPNSSLSLNFSADKHMCINGSFLLTTNWSKSGIMGSQYSFTLKIDQKKPLSQNRMKENLSIILHPITQLGDLMQLLFVFTFHDFSTSYSFAY